jgi:hypothetical protein
MNRHFTLLKALTAVLLFIGIAFGQQAWAANVTLSVDPDIPEGTAGHWYVNMGRNSNYDKVLTLTTDNLTAGQNVFKVYDDGGKNGNYSSGCQSTIVINVPEGYLIQVSGTVWTRPQTYNACLNVLNGNNQYSPELAQVASPNDGEETDFGPLTTTGNALCLYFLAFSGETFQGLDLTVRVFENVYHDITVANGIENGSVTPSVNSARFNDVVTLTVTPDENYYMSTVTWNDGTDHVITPNNGVYSFSMPPHNVTVSATFIDEVIHFWGEGNDGSAELPYVISDKGGWDLLIAKSRNPNNITCDKYFELTADISGVTQSVSFFGGHLDGKGHKITLAMNGNNGYGYGLIWRASSACSISNLTVDGSIVNQEKDVGAFFAQASYSVTFSNCRSSVAITSSYSGDNFRGGGFVGFTGGYYISVDCCVFDGSFSSSNNLSFSPWVGGQHYQVTNSAYLYGGEAYFYNGIANYGALPANPLTLPNSAIAVRTGGTTIGNGTGMVYNIGGSPLGGGFTLDGVEYYWNNATVTFGVPELIITAAIYQFYNSAPTPATINADGTASFSMPQWATTVTITGSEAHYINANGTEQTHAVSLLSSSDVAVTKAGGWYAVVGEVTLIQGLTFNGDAHLILCDGATLNVNHNLPETEIITNIAITATNLCIYGQTLGTGTLNASSSNDESMDEESPHYAYSIKASADITLCGGHVNARATGIKSGEYGQAVNCYAIRTEGSVNIIRGNLSAIAEKGGSVNGSLFDISAEGGVLLDWRRPTDRIYLTVASSNRPDLSCVSVAQGKALWNGTEVLSGTIFSGGKYSNDLNKLNGKTLQPCIAREVAGYGSGNGGWAFIASPVTGSIAPTTVGGLVASTESEYDLYRLNPSTTMWENYKNATHHNGFVLENGKGYLYATKGTKTLAFMGDAFNTGTSKEVTGLPTGYNLVGNPLMVNATINKSYYTLDETGSYVVATAVSGSTAIAPCTGVIVQSETDNGSVTFTAVRQQSGIGNNSSLNITLTQSNTRGNAVMDNAIVSFNEGDKLGKFYFGEQDANIYLPQDGKEYAIAYSEGQGEMPLNFKAVTNGSYTLTVNPEDLEMNYLHLIDHLTGADINLLVTPSYTFTAKTTDYASRFKLVFNGNSAEGNDDFAFIDGNGNIIVNGSGMVQIIDMMGRVITNVETSYVSTNGMAPGVYVLRLINGENVKTQKIVIK